MLILKRNLGKNGKLVFRRSGKDLINALLDGTLTDEEMKHIPPDYFYKDLFNAIIWKKTN